MSPFVHFLLLAPIYNCLRDNRRTDGRAQNSPEVWTVQPEGLGSVWRSLLCASQTFRLHCDGHSTLICISRLNPILNLKIFHAIKLHWGAECSSTHLRPYRYVEGSGQLHSSAVLPSKVLRYTLKRRLGGLQSRFGSSLVRK